MEIAYSITCYFFLIYKKHYQPTHINVKRSQWVRESISDMHNATFCLHVR